MNYAIILAGGVGSRFWPLSRELEPKQFLDVCSAKPMLEETIFRITPLIKKENIYIATNKLYKPKIKALADKTGVSCKNILFEPEAKNTFAPISVLSHRISGKDSQAIIAVLPSDHVIKNDKSFLELLNKAFQIAQFGKIITFGVVPKRPETGYGYIKIRRKREDRRQGTENRRQQLYEIEKFIEKPDLTAANKLVKNKSCYWNSGIFVFGADTILKEIKSFSPDIYEDISRSGPIEKLWPKLPATSVDYAIMEKTKNIALLEADYGWMDLGSWQAIEEAMKKDEQGNILKGNTIDLGTTGTVVWAKSRLVAAVGLKDVIIVDTDDALLVCAKDKTQDVKKIVQMLRERKEGCI